MVELSLILLMKYFIVKLSYVHKGQYFNDFLRNSKLIRCYPFDLFDLCNHENDKVFVVFM